jgi:hypothetical protein
MFRKVFHIIGVMLSMFAALWIITGSTVVFHQKYVYHNLLTQWQDMLLKTNAKDNKKYLICLEKNSDSSAGSAISAGAGQIQESGFYNSFIKKLSTGYLIQRQVPEHIGDHPHRGPPAA